MKTVLSIAMSFAYGCALFMLGMLYAFYTDRQDLFDKVVNQYDQLLLGIALVAVVAGGLSQWVYQWKIAYSARAIIHYVTTTLMVMGVGIWLELVSVNFIELLIFTAINSFMFGIVWLGYYFHLRREAVVINKTLNG